MTSIAVISSVFLLYDILFDFEMLLSDRRHSVKATRFAWHLGMSEIWFHKVIESTSQHKQLLVFVEFSYFILLLPL